MEMMKLVVLSIAGVVLLVGIWRAMFPRSIVASIDDRVMSSRPPEPSEPPAPWVARDLQVARALHEASLLRALALFGGRRELHLEHVDDGTVRGRWRAWFDADRFELASLKGDWSTRPMALRKLLWATHPSSLWLTIACDSERAQPSLRLEPGVPASGPVTSEVQGSLADKTQT